MNIVAAKAAKQLSEANFLVADKLYQEGNYYDWTVVVLFYSACALITSICELNGVVVPDRHKGYYNNKSKKYIKGMLNICQEYLSINSYQNYSYLLVWSQMLRYKPARIIAFKSHPQTAEGIKKMFTMFKDILKDYNFKYGGNLK